jgi:hypothetical protein
MSNTLTTSWAEYDIAVQDILALAKHRLRIFDENLSTLKLERPDRLSLLSRFLSASPEHTLQITVLDAEHLRRNCPRLMQLIAAYAHNLKIVECPGHLASLNDSLILADNEHGVVRFHKDHARAKTIISDVEACAPYQHRYDQILEEGGTPVTATTLGL